MTGPSLTALTLEIDALRAERQQTVEEHKRRLADLDSRMADLRERRAAMAGGLDLGMVDLAEAVIEVYRIENRDRGSGRSVIADAISDLAASAPALRRDYFGTKSYASWDGQRCDGPYGTGPRHGSVIFSVGLTREARGRDVSPDELNAAVAYLVAIDQVAAAKAARNAA